MKVSVGRRRARGAFDEVGLVDHTCGVAAADAYEDALVQPAEIRRGGLDLSRSTEGVLARVDGLAARQTGKHLSAAVPHSAGLHVEQVAAIRLQRVAQVGKRGAVRQHDPPVGAGSGQQPPAQLGAGECSAGQGHNAPAPLRGVAEIERFSQGRLEAVDRVQARSGKLESTRPAIRRVVRVGLQRRDAYAHPVGERWTCPGLRDTWGSGC